MDAERIEISQISPVVVGGWLLLLCLVLTFVSPATALYTLFLHVVPALMRAKTPNGITILTVRCGLTLTLAIFSFIAGLKLWFVKPGAVVFAKLYLLLYLAGNIAFFLLWLTMFRSAPGAQLAQMAWYHVVGPIPSFALWYFYLENSNRVRATYGPDLE